MLIKDKARKAELYAAARTMAVEIVADMEFLTIIDSEGVTDPDFLKMQMARLQIILIDDVTDLEAKLAEALIDLEAARSKA